MLWVDEQWADALIGDELLPAYVDVTVVDDIYTKCVEAL
jgi:hypothetical protein